jgi:transcriptional regulator with XRE-family HTH domain
VHVHTRSDWPREEFMRWLDEQRAQAGYANDFALAEAVPISHTTLSGWRNGRQRPTVAKLAEVAAALNLDPRHLWVRAGLMTAEEVGLPRDAEPEPLADADEATRDLIRNSSALDEAGKQELLEMLDEQARADAARRHSLFARLVTRERTVRA